MKNVNAEFITGAADVGGFPKSNLPEVAFAGRSNVGKSSLLNALLSRKSLARVSNTPGRTQQINFFRIDDKCHFVDLPGYGYAKVSRTDREAWARLIESYLTNRKTLRLVVVLSDIRHEPSPLDLSMFQWLQSAGRPFAVVLTKSDKIAPALVATRLEAIQSITAGYDLCVAVMAVSSHTRQGCDALMGLVMKRLK